MAQWVLAFLAALAGYFGYKAFTAARRQADAAERQLILATSPRLYIDGIGVYSLKAGQCPVFSVKIVNNGPVAANQVAVSINIVHDDGSGGYKNGENVMTIPANSRREFFIRSSAAIDPATLVGDNGKSLEIKGYYALDGGAKVEYCYKPAFPV